ncbi:hypothetical protein [Actibacterium ureilyticum]|uniref:hypothetical protein n=1 Tax=Actibacterium ureilyticum TaxID=1590614 RepID=UPI001595C54C|nr:hypothetical protein [Actibacterium ureilyticum]
MTTLLQKAREGRTNALATRVSIGSDVDARTRLVAPRRRPEAVFTSCRGNGVLSFPL